MPLNGRPESVRILSLDGGGIKGYTSLLILKRIFRTMKAEGQLSEVPKPCDVFDLIVGTSTGGLIAVMLGRLHMTIDECIAAYEQLGRDVFGRGPPGGKLGKVIKSLSSSAFYDIDILQEQVRKILEAKKVPRDAAFREPDTPACKVMLCVTRSKINKPDVLRNYESDHPTAENYTCTIWEAASATAAAPLFFKPVTFKDTGEVWCDGGMRRNNPINEALAELPREVHWRGRKIGCVLSIGTGVKSSEPLSSSLSSVLKAAVAIMTDSDDTAKVFASSELGVELSRTNRYFRFSVPQGMQDLSMDEWKKIERMRALTTDYLGHAGNGDLVARCAKSLLDPDESLHISIGLKLSLIPHHTCSHFLERPIYAEGLFKFFRSKTGRAQIYVLWGLGGVGKTQIALKFAQSMKHRFSVFWIRADQFSNFASDYTQLLHKLDRASAEVSQTTTDVSEALDKTRRRLEENPDDWLIILDNADDLEAFVGTEPSSSQATSHSISRFLPRHGRLLITTRDRRFQGRVAAANDGMKVEALTMKEAKKLLIESIPPYLVRQGSDMMSQAEQLVEELGYLPLAIAQAAANILDQQLTLGEYVSFYQDKKQRMCLMEAPARDFQTTDPRNASQSVNITWQISFDLLKDKFPQSAVFLRYVGCFYWRNIPRILIRKLPEFCNLSEPEFIQLTKKPLNLSLLEEEETEPEFVEYNVHPLLHDNTLSRLSQDELRPYLQKLVEVMWTIFPAVEERTDTNWNLAVYLAPHVARLLELCEDTNLSSRPLAVLLLHASQFFGQSNVFATAVALAERAKVMGYVEWGSSPGLITTFIANTSAQLEKASRHDEAELNAREALDWLDSDAVKSRLDPGTIDRQKIQLQSTLAIIFSGRHDAKREQIHRRQLASGLVDEWSSEGVIIRHNLAHALVKQGKFEEAESLNIALLDYAVTEAGKKNVSPRVNLIMLNLRCQILLHNSGRRHLEDPDRATTQEKRLEVYKLVFKESLQQLGIHDIDTWKAINNLISCLLELIMISGCGPILRQVLLAGIASQVKAEGRFTVTLCQITANAQQYLEYLEDTQDATETGVVEFRQLLRDWIASSGSSSVKRLVVDANNYGVFLQQRGVFDEAVLQHVTAIDMCLGAKAAVPPVYRYNLMLVLGRQGRVTEAMAYRAEHKDEIGTVESAIGTLEERLEQDRLDLEVYNDAKTQLQAGNLERDGEWWLAHVRELIRAERRYGVLEQQPVEKPSVIPEKKRGGFKLSLRLN